MPRTPSDRMLPSWVMVGVAAGTNVRGSPSRVFRYTRMRARIDEKSEGGTIEGAQKKIIVFFRTDPQLKRNDEIDVLVSVAPSGEPFQGEVAADIGGLLTDTILTVVSADGFPGPLPPDQLTPAFTVYIEDERLSVTAGHGTTTWTVTRGTKNTTVAPHAAGTPILLSDGRPLTCLGTEENTGRYDVLFRVPCQGAT